MLVQQVSQKTIHPARNTATPIKVVAVQESLKMTPAPRFQACSFFSHFTGQIRRIDGIVNPLIEVTCISENPSKQKEPLPFLESDSLFPLRGG